MPSGETEPESPPARAPRPDRRSGIRAPAALLALALLLRLAGLVASGDAELVLDERIYLARAEALLDGQGFVGSYQSLVKHPRSYMLSAPQYPGAYQPPLYTAFLSAILGPSGGSVAAVKAVQVLISTHTVWLVYAIALAWFGRRPAIAAAALAAVYPNLIAFSHYLWSETLFIWLVMLGVWLLTRSMELPTLRSVLAGGAILGLAALTRSIIFYFLPVLGAWLVFVHRARWRLALGRAAVLVATAVAVIAPWTVRNAVIHDGFVFIESAGPLNLWRGNNPGAYASRPPPPEECYAPPFDRIPLMPLRGQGPRDFVATVRRALAVDAPSDLEIARAGSRIATDYIWSDPAGFLERAGWKWVDLWNPTSFLLRHFRLGAYGEVSPAIEASVSWAAVLGYLAVAFLGVAGVVLRRRDPRAWLVVALALYVTAIHVVVFGLTRYRLPLMPFAMVFAGVALAWVAERSRAGGVKPAPAPSPGSPPVVRRDPGSGTRPPR